MIRRRNPIAALLSVAALLPVASLLLVVVLALPACETPTPSQTAAPAPGAALATPAGTPAVAQGAPNKPAAGTKVDNMTFAIASTSAAYWPINVGRIKNFYKNENINVDLLLVTGAPGQLQALLANVSQVSGTQVQALVTAVEAGTVKAHIMGNLDRTVGYAMVANKNVKTFADLKGKRFGVSSPTGGEVALVKKLLSDNGVKVADLDMISAGVPSTRVQALRSGAIDATVVSTPDEVSLVADGYVLLSKMWEALGDFPFLSYTMLDDWSTANPDLAVRFLRASYKATQWLHDPANKDEAIKILVDDVKLEPATASGAYPFYVTQQGLSKDMEISQKGMQQVLNLMVDNGDLKPPAPDWTKYVDLSFLQKAKQP